MNPRLPRRKKRSFEVDAQNARVALPRLLRPLGCGRHYFSPVREESRKETRRAEAPVRSGDRGDAFRGRIVVEQHVAAAVHLKIDEARREPGPIRHGLGWYGRGQIAPRYNAQDALALDQRGGVIVNGFSVEHVLRNDGVAVLFSGRVHRVRVTLRKWRG